MTSRSPVASTTILSFFFSRYFMISMYMDSGMTGGMLPASTRMSPSFKSSSFAYNFRISSSPIFGPCPLISLSSLERSFRLMREIPSCTWIKSACIPWHSMSLWISIPVNPARKPSAVLSKPRFFSTIDTLIPLPPA